MNANVTIKKAADGTVRLNAHVGVGSKRYFILMKHDYITLKFSTEKPTLLRLGDYVEIENVGRYEVTDPTRGEANKNTGGYDFDIRLDAQYWKFKNKLMKFMPHVGGSETKWTFTDNIANHGQQVLINIRALAYKRNANGSETLIPGRETFLYNGKTDGTGDWRIEIDASVDKTKAVTIQYDSTNIIDGIAAIAEAYECEWWFDGNVLHFGKCEHGATPVVLEDGKEIVNMSRQDSSESYATRIYAYGSDRNIPSNYRKELVFTATVEAGGRIHDVTRPIDVNWLKRDNIIFMPGIPSEASMVYDESFSGREAKAAANSQTQVARFIFFQDEPRLIDLSEELNTARDYTVFLSNLSVKFKQLAGETTGNIVVRTIVTAEYEPRLEGPKYAVFQYTSSTPLTANGVEKTISLSDQTFTVKRPLVSIKVQFSIEVEVQNPQSTRRTASGVVVGSCGVSGAPRMKAQGVTVELLDKITGNVVRTIHGCELNRAFENVDQKLTLPSGVTIAQGALYRLPQLNRALVPARYFTNKYTLFQKYSDIATNGIVNSCLLLPELDEQGNPLPGYIDVFDFECEQEAVEDVVVFEDVYPSRVSKITKLEMSDEYTDEQTELDGSVTTKQWRAYRFQDDLFNEDNPFDVEHYSLDGAGGGLKIKFQNGMLAGRTFDVVWDSDACFFEIQRDGASKLPDEYVKPAIGDEFILEGFNIAMINDENTDYIASAERDLLVKVRKYVENLNIDNGTYRCVVACDVAYRAEEISPDTLLLNIGRKVELIAPIYFREPRLSRVIGYEIPLDYAYDNPIFFIGNKAAYSRLGAIEDRLDAMEAQYTSTPNSGNQYFGGGGAGPHIITREDTTPPSDTNVYSALRSRAEFGIKNIAQKISGFWSFLSGLHVGDFIAGFAGAFISPSGDAEMRSMLLRQRLDLGHYIPGSEGGSLWVDSNGEVHFETAYLTVNKKMTVKEVEIQQQTWVGGAQINSPAAMVCERVEPVLRDGNIVAWQCYWRATDPSGRQVRNEFKIGDLARCQTFNLIDEHGYTTNRYYWRRVTSVGSQVITDATGDKWHVIVLSNEAPNFDLASTCGPAPGDRIITVGSDTEPDRQNVIIQASYGEGSPYIYQYAGIDSFTMAGKLRTRISPNGNLFTGQFRIEVDGQDRGDVGEMLDNADKKIASLEVTEDGILGKVGKISRNLMRFRPGMWQDPYQLWIMSEEPEKGAFYCEQGASFPADKDTAYFRCAIDADRFEPDTDYVLSFNARWNSPEDGEGTDMPASLRFWATMKSDSSVMAPQVTAESGPYLWGEWVRQTFRLHTNKTWSPQGQRLDLRFYTGLGAPAWPDNIRFDVEEIKLEKGTFATPFVPEEEDLESVISQQADQIAMSVKVDGKERAGMTLDAEEGITMQADKVRIKNGDTLAALFTNGILNADLIQVGKLTTIVGGMKRITVSEFNDAFIRFYHEDGITVACKIGLETVSLEEMSATPISSDSEISPRASIGGITIKPSLNGKTAIIQVFNEAGTLKWVLFLDGPVTPDTQTYSWRSLSLVAPGSVSESLLKTTATLKATEYWQFLVTGDKATEPFASQKNKVFRKKLNDAEFTSGASNYYVPNGRYYFPSAQMKLASIGGGDTGWQRRYYQITNGVITAGAIDVTEI